jgi:small subunit ribosomal protein S1
VEILSVDPTTRRIALSLKRIVQETEDSEEAAAQAQHEADMKAAEEAMANRPVNPNMRGGIGGPIKFDGE